MDKTNSLYEGRLVRLGPLDHEKDPPVVAGWTHDPLWRSVQDGVARPLSLEAVRRLLERIEKQMEETKNIFHFTLRLKDDNRLVGLARIFWIDFHNGTGVLNLGIGDAADRRHGYGAEALSLLLRFAFDDLNLHRLSAWPSADALPFIRMIEKAGFKEEGRRREAAFHDGSYWDVILMGLLRSEWEKKL
ncbi:MAG: GNAT family protein [Anaerolineales bacterium]|jgi:RimJ/RimL family protein N-acetyltransferase